ncbi:MAG: cell division protein ZapA [Chitinophagales bacterium]|nr:cell division protein ZapA [Chitinophagales bacterium]
MSDTISINITIADRTYPIKVKANEQILIKEAERLINDKLYQFQMQFTGQEKLDYLAMSALMNVVEVMKINEEGTAVNEQVNKKLSEAELLVSEGLRKP